MPEQPNPHTKGLLASLLALTDSLLAIAQTRLELLVNELEGERAYLQSWLVLIQVMLFCLGVGVVLAAMVLVMAVDDAYRLHALAAMAILFVGAGIAAGWFAKRSSRNRTRLFATSLAELKRDHTRPDKPL
jgi:uncharacterized membrane protein YqjE